MKHCGITKLLHNCKMRVRI